MEMDPPRFVIEASEAEKMAKNSGLTVPQLLPTLVKSAQNLARPTISNYHVAAVGLASDGRIFLGVNLEFPGLPLHHSVHAEQFLITNLAVHNSPRLLSLAVSAAPCGHCRQFLQELRGAADIQILITSESTQEYKPLLSILPNPFGPFDLLDQEMPLILEQHKNKLSFPNRNLSNGVLQEYESLKFEALEAANNSHAPYSGCPSGVALMDFSGKVYKGSYMESAAYNPSLGPIQAALVAFIASGGGGYEGIVAAVVVENEGAVVRQEDTARLLLNMVSPKCDFRVFHCSSALNGCIKASNADVAFVITNAIKSYGLINMVKDAKTSCNRDPSSLLAQDCRDLFSRKLNIKAKQNLDSNESPLCNAFVVAILHKLCQLLASPLDICTSKEKNLLKLTFVLIKDSMINKNNDSHVTTPKLISDPTCL